MRAEEKRHGAKVALTYEQPGDGPLAKDFGTELVTGLEALGLDSALPVAKRVKLYFGKNPYTAPDKMPYVAEMLRDVRRSIYDALEIPALIAIEPRHQSLYEAKEPLFGKEAFDKFQKSQRDIEEAGKCRALGRNTAMVFHLMRAMEAALRALAVKIGVTVLDVRGHFLAWGVIVGNIKDKIPTLPMPEQTVWTETHNLLWGINKAWRNPTMHPAETYTDEEAEDVFNAVKGFMRHLAPLV